MGTELVKESLKKAKAKIAQEGGSKRAGDELEQESAKKKKVDDDQEAADLKNVWTYREDLEVLWSIVKARFKKVQPADDMDSFLMHNLKTIFEHHVEDSVWNNQQRLAKVKNWKIFYSYGVHCVSMQNTVYYLLVEKMKKFFATKRPEERRNRPPTKAQQRSLICTNLKNMDGWKPKALKSKSFAKI
nr:hypothetical protein [Tanacetum cinerariifolium]